MAESTFPGTNPFGTSSSMHRLEEEEEHDTTTSPTASSFARSAMNPQSTPGDSFANFAGFQSQASQGAFPPSAIDPQNFPNNYNFNRRTSVSAESVNPAATLKEAWEPPVHPKTPEQMSRLKEAVKNNFLINHLSDDQKETVLKALKEWPILTKDFRIIEQGQDGNWFYMVESGSFDVYVNDSGEIGKGPNGLGKWVSGVGPGGSFGELALMYGARRAATVVSKEPSMLWAMDRETFQRIVMESAFQRRRMYEGFLEEVPLLVSLTPYERSKIADALETKTYHAGEDIIQEGQEGDTFFILEAGEAEVYKHGIDKPLKRYKKGDYFGELALLNDAKRAATVRAVTEVKVATLKKEGFQRLLGPVEDIMRRNDPSKVIDDDGVDPLTRER